MNTRRLSAALVLATALAAHAQNGTGSGIKESTDPARAAAIEKLAAELQARPPQPPVGLVRAKAAGGYSILSGGFTATERATMTAERQQYGLWIATVAKPSGAYLSDVDLRILDLKTKSVVLDRRMDGPWLMIALPPGHYEVSASLSEAAAEEPQKLSARVTVSAKGQRQAVLRFTSKATVDPEMQDPASNPFGAPLPKK